MNLFASICGVTIISKPMLDVLLLLPFNAFWFTMLLLKLYAYKI